MQMNTNKNNSSILSILTNFGCHFSCPYCVYRENGINIPFTNAKTFNWEQLEEQFKLHKGELISLSGGGDPLWNYGNKNSIEFYKKLCKLMIKYKCKLELHTSIIDYNIPVYDLCKRVVFHLQSPMQIRNINEFLFPYGLNKPIIRVVFVVQKYYTQNIVNTIVKECKDNNINELSFRQMINSDGSVDYTLYDFLKEGHKKDWYYIEQNDYNEYFVQDHIEKEYLKIKA